MRSLDKFYKYLQNHEAGEISAESAAEPSEANRSPAPKTDAASLKESRYVIRNGVTVSVPREETATKQPGPLPKDEAVSFEQEEVVSEVLPVMDNRADDGAVWQSLPENVQRLAQLSADLLPEAAAQSAERRQLIERLLNPLLSLEDTARLLGVCTATVRRYANKGALAHQRTIGQQRRFLLSDVLALLESRKPTAETAPPLSEETP